MPKRQNTTPKVFISATREDLNEYCQAAVAVCNVLKFIPIDMNTNFYVMPDGATEGSIKQLREADVLVGIYAHRYGYIEKGYKKSVTECEYDYAKDVKKISCLCFLHDENEPWPPKYIDEDSENINAFRKSIGEKHQRGKFKLVEDFKDKLKTALEKWYEDWLKLDPDKYLPKPFPMKIIGLPFQDVHLFRNRVSELTQLDTLLKDPSIHMVSVVGSMGTGKTALVSKYCEQLKSGVSRLRPNSHGMGVDGLIYFVCKQNDKFLFERLLDTTLQLLDKEDAEDVKRRRNTFETDEIDIFRYLLSKLQGQVYLLAMDNFDLFLNNNGSIHDPSLAALIDICLTAPQPLKLLVTSREGIVVNNMNRSALQSVRLNEGLSDEEAIGLLRSLDPQGDLGLINLSDDQLRDVSNHCDNLPGDLFRVIVLLHDNPDMDWIELKNTILINHPPNEAIFLGQSESRKRVLETLAIYNTPVKKNAIEYILNGIETPSDVHANLLALRNNYMVVASREHGYQLAPSIQQTFVYKQIPDTGEKYSKQIYHSRAADYFMSQRNNIEKCENWDDFQPQLEEIKHRCLAKEHDKAASVADQIQERLEKLGLYRTIMGLRELLVGHIINPKLAASNEGYLGLAIRRIGQLEESVNHFCNALDFAQKAKVTEAQAKWCGELGNTYADLVEMDRAISSYENAIDIARENGHQDILSLNLGYLAIAYRQTAQFDMAIEKYEQALEIDKIINDKYLMGNHNGNMGRSYLALGNFDQAATCFQQAAQIMNELGHRFPEGVFLYHLGETSLLKRQFNGAVESFKSSDTLLDKTDEQRMHSYTHEGLGRAYHHLGNLKDARKSYEDCRTMNMPETLYRCYGLLGVLDLEEGSCAKAEENFEESQKRIGEFIEKNPTFYEARFFWGFLNLARNKPSEADNKYQDAIKITSAEGVIAEARLYLELLNRISSKCSDLHASIQKIDAILQNATQHQER